MDDMDDMDGVDVMDDRAKSTPSTPSISSIVHCPFLTKTRIFITLRGVNERISLTVLKD